MHNLIKSRAVFEILKKPLPELLRFYRGSDSESDCDDDGAAADAATATPATPADPTAATPHAAPSSYPSISKATVAAAAAAKLNVNASVFVPRSRGVPSSNENRSNDHKDEDTKNNDDNDDVDDDEDDDDSDDDSNDDSDDEYNKVEDASLGKLKRHFEAMDDRKPVAQPKLMLPWKGFPKPQHTDRVRRVPMAKDQKHKNEPKGAVCPKLVQREEAGAAEKELAVPNNRKKLVKERALTKAVVTDEKRREQERKVALEALKLVEQRRMREPLEKPQTIIHFTRDPVDFTPEERVRVNRLRIIKREHIESVLREMRRELELKQQQAKGTPPTLSTRYICLQSAAKLSDSQSQAKGQPELPQRLSPSQSQSQSRSLAESKSQQQKQQSEAQAQPKRYIPTAKQWDERCKAKASEASISGNKENRGLVRPLSKQDEGAPVQRAMVSSSNNNIMPTVRSAVKERELFVPRYWPPNPHVTCAERRRGNLTHARNITRAFAGGLLPTPSAVWEDFAPPICQLPSASKSVKRYTIGELLKLEPQPHHLQKPRIARALLTLGFTYD